MPLNFRVAFLGDSIFESFPAGMLLPAYECVNLGVYGDNLQGVLTRVDSDMKKVKPHALVGLIGTNDFALGRPDSEIHALYSELLKKAAGYLPADRLFWCSILPTRKIENRPNDRIISVNASIETMVQQAGQHFIDVFQRMRDKEGSLDPRYTTDGLHLSDLGYIQLSKAVADALRGTVIGSGNPQKPK